MIVMMAMVVGDDDDGGCDDDDDDNTRKRMPDNVIKYIVRSLLTQYEHRLSQQC